MQNNNNQQKLISRLPYINIKIINAHTYHYEIIESIMTVFLTDILKIHPYRKKQIFLYIKENASFINYIHKRFLKNPYYKLLINPPFTFKPKIRVTININLYKENEKSIRTQHNMFYISHDAVPELVKYRNVFFLTPLAKTRRYLLPLILPPINKIKSQIPIFIIQGKIEEKRRDYRSLIPIFEKYKDRQFQIKIVGKGRLPTYLKPYEDKIILKNNLNFIDYHKEFNDVFCILPLIDDYFEHKYFKNKYSSSISYGLGYNLMFLCHTKLKKIYPLKKSKTYSTQEEMTTQFGVLLDEF